MLEQLTPKAILFDLYGTLLDISTDEHDPHVWEVLANFLRYSGSRATGRELMDEYFLRVATALDDSPEEHPDIDVLRVFGTLMEMHGVAPTKELKRAVAQLFRSLTVRHFGLFPETLEVLQELVTRGFRLGLISDSQEPYVFPELKMVGLQRFFEVTVCSAHFGYRKPDPRLFERALTKMGLTEEDVVYVGDSTYRDVTGAWNAGIHAVWIRRNRERKPADAQTPIAELSDLRGLLRIGTSAR